MKVGTVAQARPKMGNTVSDTGFWSSEVVLVTRHLEVIHNATFVGLWRSTVYRMVGRCLPSHL